MTKRKKEVLRLPSQHQIGDQVHLCLMPEDEDIKTFPALTADVLAVHFYTGKVKYDLEIRFYGDYSTRIYNIDSLFVLKYKKRE